MNKQYMLKLKTRRIIAQNTLELTFAIEDEGFRYLAGQHADFTLLRTSLKDSAGITRTFSFVSTPEEDSICIATRLSESAFKQTLRGFEPGDKLQMSRAMGNLVLHQDDTIPAVFVSGGIGITPAISIIKHALATSSAYRLILIYANKSKASTAYYDELNDLVAAHPNFTLQHIWDERGVDQQVLGGPLTEQLFASVLEAEVLRRAIFYLSGPPAMVAASQDMISANGVGLERIRTEEFSGY